MKIRETVFWVLLATVSPLAFAADAPEPTFEKHVRPILKAHCFQCHGEADKIESKLDVRLKRLLEKGGESGPAIVPGQPDQSLLLKRIESGEMPPSERKVTPKEREVLRRWIAAGAKTAAAEPETPDASVFTDEELQHWAFQPLTASPRHRVTVPPRVTPFARRSMNFCSRSSKRINCHSQPKPTAAR